MDASDNLRQAMNRAADVANPQRRSYWCESRRLYMAAGLLFLLGGLFGAMGATGEAGRAQADGDCVEARHRRRTAMSMLLFALLTAAGGAVLVGKGYCVKKML